MLTHQTFDPVSFDRRSDFLGNGDTDSGSPELIGIKNGDEMLILYPVTGFAQGDELAAL